MTITARRSHTLPTPFYFITPAWSALDILTIPFPFLYLIYHAVNFILWSLSTIQSSERFKPFAVLCPLSLVPLCCTSPTFLQFMSSLDVCYSSDISFLRATQFPCDITPPCNPSRDIALFHMFSGHFHTFQFAVLTELYLSTLRTFLKDSFLDPLLSLRDLP